MQEGNALWDRSSGWTLATVTALPLLTCSLYRGAGWEGGMRSREGHVRTSYSRSSKGLSSTLTGSPLMLHLHPAPHELYVP